MDSDPDPRKEIEVDPDFEEIEVDFDHVDGLYDFFFFLTFSI